MAESSESSKEPRPKKLSPSMAGPFGEAIKLFRNKAKLTQIGLVERIAGQCQIKQSYISRVENGDFLPSREKLDVICHALGCTAKDVWKEAEAIADLESKMTDDVVNELISCLRHERFQIPFESVTAIEDYLLGDDSQITGVIGRLRNTAMMDPEQALQELQTLEEMVTTTLVTQKSFMQLIEIIRILLQGGDEKRNTVPATS